MSQTLRNLVFVIQFSHKFFYMGVLHILISRIQSTAALWGAEIFIPTPLYIAFSFYKVQAFCNGLCSCFNDSLSLSKRNNFPYRQIPSFQQLCAASIRHHHKAGRPTMSFNHKAIRKGFQARYDFIISLSQNKKKNRQARA